MAKLCVHVGLCHPTIWSRGGREVLSYLFWIFSL